MTAPEPGIEVPQDWIKQEVADSYREGNPDANPAFVEALATALVEVLEQTGTKVVWRPE